MFDGWSIFCRITLRWMTLGLTDDKSTLALVMACCLTAPSHYQSQCWPNLMSPCGVTRPQWVNSLRLRQNGRRFADIFRCILLNEKFCILIKISLKFVPKGPINNIPALVQIMAWRRPGDKPLSEPMMVRLPTHICVTRPQWVKMRDILDYSSLVTAL